MTIRGNRFKFSNENINTKTKSCSDIKTSFKPPSFLPKSFDCNNVQYKVVLFSCFYQCDYVMLGIKVTNEWINIFSKSMIWTLEQRTSTLL